MTPNDFLQSFFQEKSSGIKFFYYLLIILDNRFRSVSSEEVHKFNENSAGKKCSNFFRVLGNQGLISYTDYLFLLTLINSKFMHFNDFLIEPSASYEVFFDVLDTNSSGSIDSDEFAMVRWVHLLFVFGLAI